MLDWKKIVRERLVASALSPADRAEIVVEVAAHLEEIYENARSQSLSEEDAVELALQEVRDWNVLAADIQRAKSEDALMNNRTKSLWLPAMLCLLGASGLLMALQRAAFQPRLVWFGHMAVLLYWPWLAGLPLCGAVGAYFSQRAQGTLLARLTAGLAPAFVVLVTFCLILPVGLARDGVSVLAYFGLAVLNWVALPAIALLVGTVPFLRQPNRPLERKQAWTKVPRSAV